MDGRRPLASRNDLGVRVARAAGDILMDHYGQLEGFESKGKIDFVTEADRESQDYIRQTLIGNFPSDGFLAEEEGETIEGTSGFRWIVDPLDGTTNYLHSYPLFTVSVGLERQGVMVFGCIYAPYLDELFQATRGGGARRNGRPIHVSATADIADSLLVTGFPYNRREIVDELLGPVRRALMTAHGFRRSGSAAYDLCSVAAGRADGFWERGLHAWDLAAGTLIVREAGGTVTDLDGGAHDLFAGRTAASNGHIHDALLRLSQPEGPIE